MIFWCVAQHKAWENWQGEFNGHFLVKKAETVSLKPEHQSETHFLKRGISLDEFWMNLVGMLSWINGIVKSFVGCNGDESLQIDGYSWIKGTGGQQCDGVNWTERNIENSDLVAGICQYTTAQRFNIAFSTKEIVREAAGPTTVSKTKVEADRALPQRTPAMCVEFPLGGKTERRHPCDGGCRLGWKP